MIRFAMTSPQAKTHEIKMPMTVTGLCTKDVEDPGSETFSPGKVTRADAQFFQGLKSECREWQSTEEQLKSIGCNWLVTPEPLYSKRYDRTYPEVVNWYTSDGDRLGQFSNCRHIIHPQDGLNWYKEFIRQTKAAFLQELTLDVIGYLPDQKVLYFASKLTDLNPEKLKKVGDTTDFFLMFSINYMEPRAMKAQIWANELVCENGMTRRIRDGQATVNHRQARGQFDIYKALEAAVLEAKRHVYIKESFIDTPCNDLEGRRYIRRFFQDSIPEEHREYAIDNPTCNVDSRIINQLEHTFLHSLKGGHLETRQDNLFRVHSAVTEYTSHHKAVRNGDDSRFAKQLDGNLSRINTQFTEFLQKATTGRDFNAI
tara:strand:+ start:1779 stop:2891 length:1113 start_codon:yes stop_codon:yes gene_type:complete